MSGLTKRNEISQTNTLISAKDDEGDDILTSFKVDRHTKEVESCRTKFKLTSIRGTIRLSSRQSLAIASNNVSLQII